MAEIGEKLKAIWAKYRFPIMLALLIIGIVVGRIVYSPQIWELGMNLFTEAISIGVTVLILEELNRRRAKREAEEALKKQLKIDAGSTSNEIAKNAVDRMRFKEWLQAEDGLLKGEDLSGANLQEAFLVGANLQGTVLLWANLQGADLIWANLQGAVLQGANLQGALLHDTKYDEKTRLPNGRTWTVETDMRYFTDPAYPGGYWRSDEEWSPAYRGKSEE